MFDNFEFNKINEFSICLWMYDWCFEMDLLLCFVNEEWINEGRLSLMYVDIKWPFIPCPSHTPIYVKFISGKGDIKNVSWLHCFSFG